MWYFLFILSSFLHTFSNAWDNLLTKTHLHASLSQIDCCGLGILLVLGFRLCKIFFSMSIVLGSSFLCFFAHNSKMSYITIPFLKYFQNSLTNDIFFSIFSFQMIKLVMWYFACWEDHSKTSYIGSFSWTFIS